MAKTIDVIKNTANGTILSGALGGAIGYGVGAALEAALPGTMEIQTLVETAVETPELAEPVNNTELYEPIKKAMVDTWEAHVKNMTQFINDATARIDELSVLPAETVDVMQQPVIESATEWPNMSEQPSMGGGLTEDQQDILAGLAELNEGVGSEGSNVADMVDPAGSELEVLSPSDSVDAINNAIIQEQQEAYHRALQDLNFQEGEPSLAEHSSTVGEIPLAHLPDSNHFQEIDDLASQHPPADLVPEPQVEIPELPSSVLLPPDFAAEQIDGMKQRLEAAKEFANTLDPKDMHPLEYLRAINEPFNAVHPALDPHLFPDMPRVDYGQVDENLNRAAEFVYEKAQQPQQIVQAAPELTIQNEQVDLTEAKDLAKKGLAVASAAGAGAIGGSVAGGSTYAQPREKSHVADILTRRHVPQSAELSV